MDDGRKKPHPDGLHEILGRRDPKSALYLGDNIDDALAAKVGRRAVHGDSCRKTSADYRKRAKAFRELGALALLERARDLDTLA